MTKHFPALFVLFSLFFAAFCETAQAQRPFKRLTQRSGAKMSISQSDFGKTADGKSVKIFKLDNGKGITVEVLNLGGIIYSFNVPDKNGKTVNVSANLETVAEYEKYRPFFGALIGRFGNRIAKGKFTLDGKEYTLPINNPPNSLHGGTKGFDTVLWDVTQIHAGNYIGLEMHYTAKDGEEGYPGKLDVTVVYQLGTDNTWTMDYTAKTDKATIINLTNHTFWNLAGFPNKNLEHVLTINADRYLPTNENLIPTGELKPVADTPFDFRTPHKIGERISQVKGEQFSGGYDLAWILNKPAGNESKKSELTLCAEVYEPKSGRTMKIETTEPSVQFYSGNFLDGSTGFKGYKYEKHGALCLETQHYPDSPNQSAFPSTVLKPGETYRSTTVHTFSVK
ncbi:MAG: galactose mutarotase [Planctomycetaceae bacterium]|jgi:aldose 1-epimerase|nr:galactose mutarotase [Planctomycetaceae bacterium]